MKKTYYILALFICASFALKAQTKIDKLSIDFGKEIKDDKGNIVKIIGEANEKIYTLVLKGKDDYSIKIFDADKMGQTSRKELKMPQLKDKELDLEEVYLLNENLYLIGSVYNKKTKSISLMAYEISEAGIVSKNGIEMFESKVERKSEKGDFYFRQSPQKNMLLVIHVAYLQKEDAATYELKLFNENMEATFETDDKVKFDDNKKDFEFDIADFEVNANNDVFLIINEGYRDKKKKEKVEKFELRMFKKDNQYKEDIVNIKVKDKEIINCKMISTAGGQLQLVGFYASVRESGKSNRELKGVYNARINISENAVSNVVYNDFDLETKTKILGKRRAEKGRELMPYYTINSIIENKDGGLIVLSEYKVVTYGKTTGAGPLTATPVTYVCNEIIVTSLKSDGTLDWSNVIAKEQTTTTTSFGVGLGAMSGGVSVSANVGIPLQLRSKGPEYLGAIPIYNNGVLMVLFNDNLKNKGVTDMDEIKSMSNYNKSVPTVFEFDETGELTRKDPEEISNNQLVIRPGILYRSPSKNEIIIYTSRKSEDRIGRITIEE